MGDNLLATPALALLKRAHPGSRLSYMVPQSGGGAELFRFLPFVDEVIEFPKRYGKRVQLAMDFRRRVIDMAVDFSWDTQSAMWGVFSGAPCRIGYRFRKSVPPWPFYTRVCGMGTAHTAEANIELVGLAGAAATCADDLKLRLTIPDDSCMRASELLARHGIGPDDPFIVIHPTSRWMFKCWTDEGNAAFIDDAEREIGARVVITSGPADAELAKVGRIVLLCKSKPVSLAGQTSLLTLAALIRRARLFVGVDSAPVHIASAVGTPVVVLFGPSGQTEWRPWQVPYRAIQRTEWSCCPCGKDGCAGTKKSRCLDDIRPAEVIAACRDLIRDKTHS